MDAVHVCAPPPAASRPMNLLVDQSPRLQEGHHGAGLRRRSSSVREPAALPTRSSRSRTCSARGWPMRCSARRPARSLAVRDRLHGLAGHQARYDHDDGLVRSTACKQTSPAAGASAGRQRSATQRRLIYRRIPPTTPERLCQLRHAAPVVTWIGFTDHVRVENLLFDGTLVPHNGTVAPIA